MSGAVSIPVFIQRCKGSLSAGSLRCALGAVAAFIAAGSLPQNAAALPLDQSTSVANFSLTNFGANSYDGLGFNAFKPFSSFLGSDVLSLSAFTGHEDGSVLDFTLISHVGAFDGSNPQFADHFGVLDSNGNFINSGLTTPGSHTSMAQGANQQFTLALQSPEGLFSSIDSHNPDGAPHLIVREFVQSGQFVVDPVDLHQGPPITIDLATGDKYFLIAIEDLLASGNLPFLGVPDKGDFDYNDMVVLVRQTAVPEPASVLLFGAAAAGLVRRRSRKALA